MKIRAINKGFILPDKPRWHQLSEEFDKGLSLIPPGKISRQLHERSRSGRNHFQQLAAVSGTILRAHGQVANA
jgi:hypothetical protein